MIEGREGREQMQRLWLPSAQGPPARSAGLSLTEVHDYETHEIRGSMAPADTPPARAIRRPADLPDRDHGNPIRRAAVRNRAQDQVLPVRRTPGRRPGELAEAKKRTAGRLP